MVERAHVVDKADTHMGELETPSDNGYGCCALGAVAEDRCPCADSLARQADNENVAVTMMKRDVGQVLHPFLSERLVRMVAKFDRMDIDIRQIFAQHVGRLPAGPAALNDDLNTEPAAGLDDQRHLTVRDAARFVGFCCEGSEEVSQGSPFS